MLSSAIPGHIRSSYVVDLSQVDCCRSFSIIGLRLAGSETVSMSRVNKVGVALQSLDLLPLVRVSTNSSLWGKFRGSRGVQIHNSWRSKGMEI